MNSVALIGRLTRDPEVRYTGDQMAIATFSIAIDRPPKRDGTKETDFPRITVFGRQAENCERYLKKGRLVGITGHIQTGSYTNRNGDKVYTTDVVAERVEFLEWGDRDGGSGQGSYGSQSGYGGNQGGYGGNQGSPSYGGSQENFGGNAGSGSQESFGGQGGFGGNAGTQSDTAGEGGSQLPRGFEAIDDDDIPF